MSAMRPNLLAVNPLKLTADMFLVCSHSLKSLYIETECAAWLGESNFAIAISASVCILDEGDENTFSPALTSISFCTPIFC